MNRYSFRAAQVGTFLFLLLVSSLQARAAASPNAATSLAAYADHLLATTYPADSQAPRL